VNWERDTAKPVVVDLRSVVDGDPSPDGGGSLKIVRGIEVGHIFQLGDKYSRALSATVLDQNGRESAMLMGCYGIGITRIVAAAIEQNYDENGIIWPEPMSPFDATLLVLNPKKSSEIDTAADQVFDALTARGLDVLVDDRDARPGFKFADADLIGIPHRLVVGERGIGDGIVEYRNRRTGEDDRLPLDGVADALIAHMHPNGSHGS
jgi:prolyl-tRNA synthetase